MQIPFTKMHGLGNDFVVIDWTRREAALPIRQIAALADRRRGIGFDQLLVLEPARQDGADFHYRIFNPDGAEVEHCGNGARCLARFIRDKGLCASDRIVVSTVNRTLTLRLLDNDNSNENGNVEVDMGVPDFRPAALPFLASRQQRLYQRELAPSGIEVHFAALSMGNPHAVIEVEDLANAAVKEIGEALGNHCDFPAGVNVGFMKVENRQRIGLRVHERGPGETPACGSGACAAAVSGIESGSLDSPVRVLLAGGELRVEWQGASAAVFMSGPAQAVYEGIVTL